MILKTSNYFVATLETLKPLGVIAFSIACLYFLYFSPVFRAQRLTCVQDLGEPCQNDFVLAELDQLATQNLFLIDSSALRARLLAGDPTLRSLRLTKTLPNTLTLELQSVSPVLAVAPDGSDRLLLLDSSFRVIKATTQDPHLPLALYHSPLSLRIGQAITDPTLLHLLTSALTLSHAFPESAKVELEPEYVALTLPGKYRVLFTLTRSLDPQIAALRSLLQNATIPPMTREIDVRYTQPILRSQSSL